MIDRAHALPITKQAVALGLSCGSVYYVPRLIGDADLALMQRLDALHLDFPFAGARMLKRLLRCVGVCVGRRHLTTLMHRMGITAIAPQPGSSKRHRAHPVFPYLLRGRTITHPNQVWAMDISVPQQAA
jgi:putative transposase